jgi:iron complex outermembrane receptor protein
MRTTLGGIAAAALCAPALAQEDAVVVTATRAPRPALEIPASVDRLYGADIRTGRPQVNLSESLGAVPGIVVQNRQNYAQDLQVSSRGFGARSTFGVRGIRLYADGIPANQPDGQGQTGNFDLGSAERIEVLRGPFSSLYGNSAGGVISIETQSGPALPTLEGDFLAGSYRTRREAAKFGGQFGAVNGIGSLSHFHTDGYRNHSMTDRDLANAKLRIGGDGPTTVTVVGNALDQPQTQDPLGLRRSQFEQDPRQADSAALAFNTRKTIQQEQGGVNLRHRLGGGNEVEGVAYAGHRFVEQFLGVQNNGVVRLSTNYDGGALRFFHSSGPVRLAVGAEYDAMSQGRKGFDNLAGVPGALRRDEVDDVTSTGFFGQGEWTFAERWIAHAGVRSTEVRFNINGFLGSNGGAVSYRGTTPVAGLVFRATPTFSVYGTLGRGFENPTLVEIANRDTAGSGPNLGLGASRSRHRELGVKTILGRLRANAALFNIVTENEIVVDQNSGGRTTFKNVGHTDRDGVELSADTIASGPWQARVAYTHLRAQFREGFNTVIGVFPNNVPVAVPDGASLPGVPKNYLYGELRYRVAPFFAQVEGLYKSRVAVNDPNTDYAASFTVWNAAAGLMQERGRLRLSEFVRVDNLADRNYVGSVIVNETSSRYFEPAPRRSMSVGLQATLTF